MSPNEEFVLNALVGYFGGVFIDGEDPPDAYLLLDSRRIAVEVSMLVQQLVDKNGNQRSRFKDDIPAVNLANDLDDELNNLIPADKYVFLIIPSPINDIRKTRKELGQKILEKIETNSEISDFDIRGNRISINIYDRPGSSGKKIAAAVSNRHSSANIGLNAQLLLQDRISTKNCVTSAHMAPNDLIH